MNGIRVAQSGFKVSDPDYRQAYSSEWPVLNIVASGFGAYAVGEKIYEHNLGYFPAFLWFTDRRNNTQTVGTSSFPDGFDDDVHITNEGLYHTSPSSQSVLNIRWYIFNIDIEQQFTAPTVETGSDETYGAKEELGVRFSRSGKTIRSRRFIDQTVRSDALIPLIHSVNPGVNDGDRVIKHDLGYPPKALGYVYDPSSGGYKIGVSALDSSIAATNTDVTWFLSSFSGEKDCIIILKDPSKVSA